VEQSRVPQQPIPVADPSPAEQPGLPSAQTIVTVRAYDLPALCAFALYFALSILFFGRGLFGHISDAYFGVGVDPGLMMWSLVWWPHALADGLNPLMTHAIWAPSGFNLAWSTSIALASVIASPLTATLGPVPTYNILCLLSLPTNAYCAFILCRYLTQDYSGSLLGGYVFGFSAFMLGQLISGHLHLLLVFSVPLFVYLVMRRIAGEITQRKFTLSLTLILVAQFLLSPEIFATMTMFASLALLLTWSLDIGRASERILNVLKSIAYAYGMAILGVTPYLYYFFAYKIGIAPLYTPAVFSADPLNFLVPTPINELGRIALFKSVSAGFVSGWTVEAGAYFSLPLILVAILYTHRHWTEPVSKLLVYCLAATIILALGPILHIYTPSHQVRIVLPWWLLAKLPLLKNALAVRFSMYAFLVLAVISAHYFASERLTPVVKLTLAVAVVAANLPNFSADFWVRSVRTPRFFQNAVYKHYLAKGKTVLIVPYAYTGNSMLWQAQTHMYFNMAEGVTLPPPVEFRRWPIFPTLTKQAYIPNATEQFRGFLSAHSVEAIIVTDEALPTWQVFLSTLHVRPIKIDGVSLYRISAQPRFDVETTLRSLRARFDTERLVTLVMSAEKYLSQGKSVHSLSVLKAKDLDLVPQDSLIGPPVLLVPGMQVDLNQDADPHLAYGVWLGETSDGLVGVGEQVWYSAVAPVVEKLRGVSSGIYFPYPDKLATTTAVDMRDGWLLITFTRAQLTQASALLAAMSAQGMLPQASPTAATQRTGACQANVR
jgi:hypothetical protein